MRLEDSTPARIVLTILLALAVACAIALVTLGALAARQLAALDELTADPALREAVVRLQWHGVGGALIVAFGGMLGAGAIVAIARILASDRALDAERRRELEAALDDVAHARDAAERASVSKSKLIARVSHELRTPMNGIVGITEVLLAEGPQGPLRTRLEVLDHSAQAMRSILDELLQVSRGDAGVIDVRHEAFDLYELVAGRVSLHASSARAHGVELLLDATVELPRRVLGDPVRVGQVLGNLVDNAVKYAAPGVVRIRLHDAAEGIGFAVVDHGPGVPAEHRDRIFEAFARLPQHGRGHAGTGLGLTLCRQIVEAMGGTIGVDETPGGGATFWFTVPLEPASETERARRRTPTPEALPALRVLGVDDNVINGQVLGAMLQALGVKAETVTTGDAALARVAEDPFDLVLMDVEMPGMDGRECTRRMRARGVTAPIVAFTAHAMVDERNACMDAGMNDVLAKPVSLDDLRRTLARWATSEGLDEAAG
jgi:signal transduction histidine kinase/ActR/RegA family two-component response regulator